MGIKGDKKVKKILAFIVSFFTLALFVVSLTQPMNVNAAGGTKGTLEFTEVGGNFLAYEGGSYSKTGEVEVAINTTNTGTVQLEIEFNPDQLTFKGVKGLDNNEFGDSKGKVSIWTKERNFTLKFAVATKSANVYGVPFDAKVTKFQIAGADVTEKFDDSFYFVRGFYGDINCNGVINTEDYSYIKHIILGKSIKVNGVISDVQGLADINHDGVVNYVDYQELYNAIVNAAGNNEDIKLAKYSDAGYCKVVVKEEGQDEKTVAVKYGAEYNGQKITGNNQVVEIPNDPDKVHKVHYFFSTAVGAAPVVEYVEEGDPIKLIVPNGTLLINGYLNWYKFTENPTGFGNLEYMEDEQLMGEENVYLYAHYSNTFKPTLYYKTADGVETLFKQQYEFFETVVLGSVDPADPNYNSVLSNNFYDYADNGYEFAGWYLDKELTQPIDEIELMLKDTVVYCAVTPKQFTVTFKPNNGEAQTVKTYDYKEAVEALKVKNPGFIFQGWYEAGASDAYVFDKMPAKNIVLEAKWYDVVKDVVDYANKEAQNVGIDSALYGEYDPAVEAVEEVFVTLNVDELYENGLHLDAEAAYGMLERAVKHAVKNYTADVVNKIAVNGYVVYENGTIYNSNIKLALISIVNGLLSDVANGTVDDVIVKLDDSRVVTVKAKLEGKPEHIEKLRDLADKLAKHIEVFFNVADNETVVEVLLPRAIVEKMEKEASDAATLLNGYPTVIEGEALVDFVNTFTVGGAIAKIGEVANGLNPATTEILNKVVKAALTYSDLFEHIDAENDIEIYVDGQRVVLSSEANTFKEFVDELVAADSQIAGILDKSMEEYYNPFGYHYFPIEIKFNLEEVPQLQYTSFTEKIELRVYFYAKEYSINFDPNGGTLVIPTPQDGLNVDGYEVTGVVTTEVEYEISKVGYTFAGWYKDAACTTDFVGMDVEIPYGNFTYYAKWIVNEYLINYENNDDTLDPVNNPDLKFDIEDGVITLATPTREHYIFAGWYEKADFSGTKVVTVDAEDLVNALIVAGTDTYTVYAKWEKEIYTIEYRGEKDVVAGIIVDSLWGADHNPLPDGKDVIYYYTKVNLKEQFDNHLIGIEKVGHTITGWMWRYDDPVINAKETISGLVDKADYNIITSLEDQDTFNIPGNVIVRPVFTANKYVVEFDVNGTLHMTPSVTPTSKEVTYGQTYGELPVPACTGYSFLGWFTDPTAGVEVKATDTVKILENTTLYAHWEVTDIVKNAVENTDAFLKDAIVEPGLELPYEFKHATAANSKGYELYSAVTLVIKASEYANLNSYQLNEDAFLDLFGKIADAIAEDITLVNKMTIDGEVIFSAGKISNAAFRNFLLDLLSGSIAEIAKGNVPTVELVIDEVVGVRTVKLAIELEGNDSQKAKLKGFFAALASHISASYDNDSVDVVLTLPQSLIQGIEEEVNGYGLTLEQAFDTLTVDGALQILIANADKLAGSKADVANLAAKLVAKLRKLINQVAAEDLVKITANDSYGTEVQVFNDAFDFNPATEDLAGILAAIKATLTPEFLGLNIGDEFQPVDGVLNYTIPLNIEADVTALGLFENNIIKDLVNVTIILDANDYVVTLDANGGEFSGGTVETFVGTVGTVITPRPTRGLYVFKGWNTEADGSGVDYDRIPNKDITLYAKWEEQEYTLTFVANTGKDINGDVLEGTFTIDGVVADSKEFDYSVLNSALTVTTESVEAYYVFGGWYLGTELVSVAEGKYEIDLAKLNAILDDYSEAEKEATVTAQWVKNDYKAFVKIGGWNADGTPNPDNISYGILAKVYKFNDKIDLSALPNEFDLTRMGYEIIGWKYAWIVESDIVYVGSAIKTIKTDGKVLEDVTGTELTVKKNVFIVPVYGELNVEITLNGNCADTVDVTSPVYVKYNSDYTSIDLEKPVRSGYTFKGWYFDPACTLPVEGKANVTNYVYKDADEYKATLYAKWVEIVTDAVDQIEGLLEKIDKDPANKLLDIKVADSDAVGPLVIDVLVNIKGICDGTPVIDETAISGLTTKIVDYVTENYATVNTVKINGVTIIDNKVIQNKGIQQLVEEYLSDLLNSTIELDEVLPSLVIELAYDDLGGSKVLDRKVTVNFKATPDTTQAHVDELNSAIQYVKDAVSITIVAGHYEIVITVPETVISELELLAELGETSIEAILADLTIAQLIEKIANYDKSAFIPASMLSKLNTLVGYADKFSELITSLLNSSVVDSDLIADGAVYDPANSSLDAAIKALGEILSIKDEKLGNPDVTGVSSQYVFDFNVKYDGSNLGDCDNVLATADGKVIIVVDKHPVTYTLYVDGVKYDENTNYVGYVWNPAVPVKEGYTFRYWADGADNQVTDGVQILFGASSTDLYAVFSKNEYTVTLDANGGKFADDTNVKANLDITFDVAYGNTLASNVATRAHYTFVGWNTKADGTGTYYASTDLVDIAAAHTLYAIWTADTYTVNVYGWSNALVDTIMYNIETTAAEFAAELGAATQYAKDGYTVTWPAYDLDAFKANKSGEIKAVYTANNYTVSFFIDGVKVATGNFTVENTINEIKALADVNMLDPKYGRTGEWDVTEVPAADMDVNAKFVDDVYTLVFTPSYDSYAGHIWNGTTEVSAPYSLDIKYGDRVAFNFYTRLHCQGYEFVKWFYFNGTEKVTLKNNDYITEVKHAGIEALGNEGKMVIYAEYKPANYRISFYVEDEIFSLLGNKENDTMDIVSRFIFPTEAKYIQVIGFKPNGEEIDLISYTDIAGYKALHSGEINVEFHSDIKVYFFDAAGNRI